MVFMVFRHPSHFSPWHLPSAHQQVGASYCNVQMHKIHRAEGLHRAILGALGDARDTIFLGGPILEEISYWGNLIFYIY